VRFISFHHQGRQSYGAVEDDFVVDLGASCDSHFPDLRNRLLDLPSDIRADSLRSCPRIAIADIHFRPVIPNPSKIVCVGLNYREHAHETGRSLPQHPVLFLRLTDSQVGHLQPLVRPQVSEQLDFEVDLAVINGRPGRHIRAAEALKHVVARSARARAVEDR
jgi:2-keto-4-pentenoate hydratase/2-oxohepta-3-ene-1,7-dioic acid hydratase in catechol pathway